MKHPTTTFLVYLFPLLVPTLAFAHARPHPHPHAAAAGEGSELAQVQRLKRQGPVLNETLPIETQSTSSEAAPTTTSKPFIDLDGILSSIESGVLGETPSTTSASDSATTTSGNPTEEDTPITTTSSNDATSTDILDTSLPTTISVPTLTQTEGLNTELNTPSITVQPPIPIDTTSASSEEETTTSKTKTNSRPGVPIIETLSDILTSLLPDEDPTTTTTTSSESSTITDAPSASPTGLDDILSSILSDVTSVVDDVTSLLPNATDIITSDLPDVTSILPTPDPTVDPTIIPTDIPTPTDTLTDIPTPTDTPIDTPTDTPTDIPTNTGVIQPTDAPTNTTIADPTITEVPPTDTPTTLPTDTVTPTDVVSPTDTATQGPSPTLPAANATDISPTTSVALETSLTSDPTLPTDTTGVSSAPTNEALVPITTQKPSPTTTDEDLWFGTSLVTQAPPTGTGADSGAATETSLPSGVPEAITPPGGVPNEPDNSTLVQIGFTRQWNYAFVSDSLQSAAQICSFLPRGLADGLGVSRSEIRMHTLQPLQPEGLDYIVTLGLVYIPTDLFTKLQSDIHIPLSALYTNPDPTIKKFMDTIDPSIPLIPGQNIALMPPSNGASGDGGSSNDPDWVKDGDNLVDGSEATSTSGADSGDGADPYNSEGSRNTITSKQVTIGVASVGAAAIYGVAMYFLAKRYRNNRLNHRRSQSLSGGGIEPPMSDMRSSGALSPMMSTNFFNNGRATPAASDKRGSKGSKTSARGQISAPMMSENSLGWD